MKPDTRSNGLSVVILHYNRPWCLELALAALRPALTRSALPYEFIIADDGSDERLHPFLKGLGADQLYIQPNRVNDGSGSTVFYTLQAAYQMASLPYLLYLEDDFWYLPQGFQDQQKDHSAGLLAIPDRTTELNPLFGAVSLLGGEPTAHFVELARSYNNPRYPSIPATERIVGGVQFRAKQRLSDQRWYTCAWPHVMRTAEARSLPMPVGKAVWSGEIEMCRARDRAFGPGTWVYDPERCFFAHVNIFSWREIFKPSTEPPPELMPWSGVPDSQALPYHFKHMPGFNRLLLAAFLEGRLRSDLEAFYRSSLMDYTYWHIYRRVAS